MLNKPAPRTLIVLGMFLIALRAVLQRIVANARPHRDFTDFALGLLMGVGIGLVFLGLWRLQRNRAALILVLGMTAAAGCSTISDQGTGIPIVFVHGNGGNADQWRAQVDHFRGKGHRAHAIDLPGFGNSAPPANGDYSLPAMAEAIDRATARLRLNRFVIVGHSYAGAVVGQYAATHPEKVAGVVYVDAAAITVQLSPEQQEQFKSALRANRMQVVRAWFAPMLKPSSDAVREAVFASVEKSSIDAFIAALDSLTTWTPQQLINAYRGPRLAIVASDLETPASFQKQFPDVPAVRIAGAGHWLMLDKPDEVNAAIEKFVGGL